MEPLSYPTCASDLHLSCGRNRHVLGGSFSLALLLSFSRVISLASIESAIRRGKLCQARPVLSLVTLQLHRQRAISYPEIAIGCN